MIISGEDLLSDSTRDQIWKRTCRFASSPVAGPIELFKPTGFHRFFTGFLSIFRALKLVYFACFYRFPQL
jgi:hypothetical protein